MPFNKESGKQAGRKSKRSKSKSTLELQSIFGDVLANNAKNIEFWINETAKKQPDKALDLIIKIASFLMPKIRAIELDINTKICHCEDLSLLSDADLEEQIHQANRVLHDNYCSETRTFKPTK